MSTPRQVHGEFLHDEQSFRRTIPYPLVATNIPGAYASPAWADDFDPNTASPADFVKNGLLIHRPTQSDDPVLVKAWDRAFSKKWRAEDRIIPQLEPQPGKVHILRKPPRVNTNGNNPFWSGGVMVGQKWSGVLGFWHVPTVSAAPEPQGTKTPGWDSSSWLGIDGYPGYSSDVLQAGVQQYVGPSGSPSYVAWYEWYTPGDTSPSYVNQVNITNVGIKPGDYVYCGVAYVGSTAGYFIFKNERTGKHFSMTLAPPKGATFAGNTIEWIMEDPNGGEPDAALAKFTQVEFELAVGCKPGATNLGELLADTTNPSNGFTVNIETSSDVPLTKTTLGNYTVKIDFIG